MDVNRLGRHGPTDLGWDIDAYARRVESFGAHGGRWTVTISTRSTPR